MIFVSQVSLNFFLVFDFIMSEQTVCGCISPTPPAGVALLVDMTGRL